MGNTEGWRSWPLQAIVSSQAQREWKSSSRSSSIGHGPYAIIVPPTATDAASISACSKSARALSSNRPSLDFVE